MLILFNRLINITNIKINFYKITFTSLTAFIILNSAFSFSNGIAYVQAAIEKGLDPNIFGQRLSFFFNAHNGFLEEIAKFRAARELWAEIMKKRNRLNKTFLEILKHIFPPNITHTRVI